MKCEDAQALFVDYQDGDIRDADRAALEAHLASCDACAREWDEYARCVEEVSGMLRVPPPEGFTSRVKQTIGKRSRGRFFGGQPTFPIGFAVVSFVLILFFMLLYLVIVVGRGVDLVDRAEEAAPGGQEAAAPGSVD
jgi:anti-sigma factor RsiW